MSFELFSPDGNLMFDSTMPLLSVTNKNFTDTSTYWEDLRGPDGWKMVKDQKGALIAIGRDALYTLESGANIPAAGRGGFEFYSEEGVRLMSSSASLASLVRVFAIQSNLVLSVPSGKTYAILPLSRSFSSIVYKGIILTSFSLMPKPHFYSNRIEMRTPLVGDFTWEEVPIAEERGYLFMLIDVTGI